MIPRYLGGATAYPIERGTRYVIQEEGFEIFTYYEDLTSTYEGELKREREPSDFAERLLVLIELSLDLREGRAGLWKKGDDSYDLHWLNSHGDPIYRPVGVRWMPD
jgi:hypothetical protein